MPRIFITLNERERDEAVAAKGDRGWREILLEALDIQEDPRRQAGRPPWKEG